MSIEFSLLPPGKITYPLCCMCVTPSTGHLFFPNVEYLVKFANGDLGIADTARTNMILQNINLCKTPQQMGIFAQSSGAILKKSPENYFSNGTPRVPASDVTLNTASDSTGFKALEKSVIQSIFQSQKPYMEIIQILVQELIEVEDVIARVLALADISLMPRYNPNALGYLGGNQPTVYTSLSQLNSLSNYTNPPINSTTSSNPGTQSNINYDVISTIYSTGQYDPSVDYNYEYINIPSNIVDINQLSTNGTSSNSIDPYAGIRPQTIVFGIWNNQGIPISPPDWLIKSGKWFGQFPFLTGTNYIWQKSSNPNYIGSAPPDNTGGWTMETYTSGTFSGQPILAFSNNETQALINYYTGYITDSLNMNGTTLTSQQKTVIINQVLGVVESNNNINNQLQNESIYGFLPSLVLSGGGTSPFSPEPLSPYDITISNTQSIWVDPESEYDMKIIKCDSTPDITYVDSNGNQQSDTIISRFITNTLSIVFNPVIKFNATLYSGSSASSYKGITEFDLDNPSNSITYTMDISLSGPFPASIIGAFQISTGKVGIITTIQNNNTLKYSQYAISSSVSSSLTSGNAQIQNGPSGVISISFESGIIVRWYTSITSYVTTPPGNWSTINLTVTANSPGTTLFYIINGVDIMQYTSSNLSTPDTLPPFLTVNLPNGEIIDVENGIVTDFYIFKGKNIKPFLPTNKNTENIVTINNNFNTSTKTISIPPNSIRVESSGNPFGAMIDPSQISNKQLEINTPYSSGFYGSCYDGQIQDIAQIYRYMTSATDSQTYYMIEGIYSPDNLQNNSPASNSSQGTNQGGPNGSTTIYPSNMWYKKPQSIGAIKEFSTMLSSIFLKLLPAISNLEKILSDPNKFPQFLEEIVANCLGDSNGTGNPNFLFFSSSFINQFNNLANAPKSQRASIVKNSQLSNFVTVDINGNYKFILDGAALCSIFGTTFGVSINNLSPSIITSTQSGQPPSDAINQPILGFILNLITFPFNIIKSIIDYITNFFKNLNFSNIQNEISDFISFKWLLSFFDPNNILQLAGIKYNITELNNWIKNYSSYPKNSTFDLSQIMSAPFLAKLFTATKDQFKSLEKTPIEMIAAIINIFQSIVNAFIDFIWSLLGLGAILAPPCLNLRSAFNQVQNIPSDELQSLLQGSGGGTSSNYDFNYNIQLPDGTIVKNLNISQVDAFIQENGDIKFYFE